MTRQQIKADNKRENIPSIARKATSDSFKSAIGAKLSVIVKEGRNIVEILPNGNKVLKQKLSYRDHNHEFKKKFKLL